MGAPKVDSATVERLYQDGLTVIDIAQRLDVHRVTIFKHLRKLGLETRRNGNGHQGLRGLSPAALRAGRCRRSPSGAHHRDLDRPTAEGVRGVCRHCGDERWFPSDTDNRNVSLAGGVSEFGYY